MATTNINIRTDSELKAEAQSILSELGLDLSTAINVYLTQIVHKKGIPFELTIGNTNPRYNRPKPGCMKGKIKESDDHNWFEPMEEFEEYM